MKASFLTEPIKTRNSPSPPPILGGLTGARRERSPSIGGWGASIAKFLSAIFWFVCLFLCCECGSPAQTAPTADPKAIAFYNFVSQVNALAFRPGSNDLAAALYGVKAGGKAIVWKSWIYKTVKDATLDSMPSPCFSVAYDSRGSQAAWCSWTPGKQIRIQGSKGETRSIDCGKIKVLDVAFDPSSSFLASISTDGIVRVWETETRRIVHTLPPGGARGLSVAYSPDGRMLAASFRGSPVLLWRNDNLDAPPLVLDARMDQANSLAFSPDSLRLATAAAGKSVSIWETASGRLLRTLSGPHLDPVTCLRFTPDGKYLATGDKAGRVVFWNSTNFRPLTTFFPHKDSVYCLAFSSDGAYLATGAQDRSVKLFRTQDIGFKLGRIRLVSRNEKFGIKVDGEAPDLDDGATLALTPGRHDIVVTTEDGSNSKSYPVEVTADTESTLAIDVRSALGKLFIESNQPSELAISNGVETTSRSANETIDRLIPGRYTVSVTPKDRKYMRQSILVEIKPDEVARISVSHRLAPGDPSPPPDREALRQVRINPRDGAEMIWIPAGTFTIGSKSGDRDARPPHSVSLKGFWIYRYPVTVSQYRKFCDATAGSKNERKMPPPPKWGWIGDHPMVFVSWQDAIDYSRWAFGEDKGIYLPKEVQYERAMQGPQALEYPWGADFYAEECINSIKPNHPIGTAGVGTRSPNGWGLYDIAGNVWEWCADWYDPDSYRKPEGSELAAGKQRSVRGGAWDVRNSKMFRTDFRGKESPASRTPNTGFRCAAG